MSKAMCNRYSQTKRERDLVTALGTLELSLEPRYNIAPTNVVTLAAVRDGTLRAEPMSWKFSRTDGGIVTNCKSETAAAKPFFKHSWNHRRCLIPADGFYEWKQEGNRKQPYRFVLKSGEPFWFAGLWQPSTTQGESRTPAKATIPTESEFVILTREANADVSHLHTRMPLILKPAEIDQWLDPKSLNWIPEGVPEGALQSYAVPSLVSTPGLETPDCIIPFVPNAAQGELF
jgi:putative SOS response-associated peptidase YedK